jgi:cytochrome c oxidase assembly protein subunit 11
MDKNLKTVFTIVPVIALMGSLAWASVPLYDWFCRTTGFGGSTQVSSEDRSVAINETIDVRFDASTERDMPWNFEPLQQTMTVQIGETGLAFYQAHNPTGKPVAGTATYNVAPFSAGSHFVKIHCFCFDQQVLEPYETVEMPVTFYVDPKIRDDPEANTVEEITLSYTFYQTQKEASN